EVKTQGSSNELIKALVADIEAGARELSAPTELKGKTPDQVKSYGIESVRQVAALIDKKRKAEDAQGVKQRLVAGAQKGGRGWQRRGLAGLRGHASERARSRDGQGIVHRSRWRQSLDSAQSGAGPRRRIRLDSAGVPIKSPVVSGAPERRARREIVMAVNLIELAKGYLTPDIIQKAASFVGESEPATQKAVNGIVPTLLAGLVNQASTSGGAEKLSRILDTGKYDGSALNNLSSLFSGGETTQKAVTQGKDILSSLFGNKTEGLIDQIARFAGLRTGSASSLLALILPLILNLLGRQRATIGQSPSALASLLGDQKGFLSGLLPAGI